MSFDIGSNQLKLNLNAVVDKLNLVNVLHKPEPIYIEKVTSKNNLRAHESSFFNSNSQFEVIDETKMSMYSYLVQRELKNKEWLSKFNPDQIEIKKPFPISPKPIKSIIKKDKNEVQSVSIMTKPSNSNPTRRISSKQAKNQSTDLQNCCKELIKNLENFSKILSEFKHERLKIVFNDPVEEEKQTRIQIEQIKYLSRSIFNYQNQLNTLKNSKKNESFSQRLIHTARQIIKLLVSFGEIYPYRQDKDNISEKLCLQFYKQFNRSIKNFIECVSEDESLVQLNDLIDSCDKYFVDDILAERNEKSEKKTFIDSFEPKNKKTNQVLNIIRVSRNVPKEQKEIDVKVVSSKRVFNKKKPKTQTSNIRFEISPPRPKTDKPKFENKTLKTAKLYPSNRRSRSNPRVQSDLDFIPTKDIGSIKKNDEINKIKRSIEELNSSLDDLNISNEQIYKPAFRHLSSPKLSKIGYNRSKSLSRSRSRSHSKSSVERGKNETKLRKVFSNESLYSTNDPREDFRNVYSLENSFVNSHFEPYDYSKSILKKNQIKYPNKIQEKLDLIRRENDALRKKYEKISYFDASIQPYLSEENKRLRRPYEECYLDKNETNKIENYESKVTFEQVYKPLNGPSIQQLKRVIKYAEDFEDYNRKTSITKIGDTEFDDFDLFELLSNDLFQNIFDSIYNEIEKINDKVATNLVNNEFETNDDNETILNAYEQSFDQTSIIGKNLIDKSDVSNVNRKYSKTSTNKTTSKTTKTSTSSNYDDYVTNNLNANELIGDDQYEIQEDIPNQINTQYSSFHSNVEETISSISD